MPEITEITPINQRPIKTSEDVEIQDRVNAKKEEVNKEFAGIPLNEQATNHLARQKVAHELISERAATRAEKLRKKAAELEEQSTIDPLTGLYNRRGMEKEWEKKLARAKRDGKGVGVMLWDFDHFKWVNDGYGHNVGDDVLRTTRALATRKEEPVGRWGGEEFLQIIDETDSDGLSILATRHMNTTESLTEKILKDAPYKENADPAHKLKKVTLSMGVAFYKPGMTLEDIVEQADKALYQAKLARETAVLYNPEGRVEDYPYSPVVRLPVANKELVAA